MCTNEKCSRNKKVIKMQKNTNKVQNKIFIFQLFDRYTKRALC